MIVDLKNCPRATAFFCFVVSKISERGSNFNWRGSKEERRKSHVRGETVAREDEQLQDTKEFDERSQPSNKLVLTGRALTIIGGGEWMELLSLSIRDKTFCPGGRLLTHARARLSTSHYSHGRFAIENIRFFSFSLLLLLLFQTIFILSIYYLRTKKTRWRWILRPVGIRLRSKGCNGTK